MKLVDKFLEKLECGNFIFLTKECYRKEYHKDGNVYISKTFCDNSLIWTKIYLDTKDIREILKYLLIDGFINGT